MKKVFPWGFRYPRGFVHNDQNPDPALETLKKRMEYLNEASANSAYEGHIFAEAMDMFQKSKSGMSKKEFWEDAMKGITPKDLALLGDAIAARLNINVPPPLDFPNAVAVIDCRFVDTEEWQYLRHYSIGGSDAAAVLGLSKYNSPAGVYLDKKHFISKPLSPARKHIFDFGHEVEDFVIESNAQVLGAVRYPEHRMFAHRDYPYITCNPDAFLMFPNGKFTLFEAKSASYRKIDEWRAGIPEYYVPQPRQYLEVLDDDRFSDGYIGAVFGALPQDRVLHSYVRDRALGKAQVEATVQYWTQYVEKDVMPPLCGNYELDSAVVYRDEKHKQTGLAAALPASCASDFERYAELERQRAAVYAEAKKEQAREALLLAQITDQLPDGTTICSAPNGLRYRIDITDKPRQTLDQLAIPAAFANRLRDIAAMLRDGSDSPFTTPKIKIQAAQSKAKKGAI